MKIFLERKKKQSKNKMNKIKRKLRIINNIQKYDENY